MVEERNAANAAKYYSASVKGSPEFQVEKLWARGTQAQDQGHPEETKEACPVRTGTTEKKLSMKQREREKYSLAASFLLGVRHQI